MLVNRGGINRREFFCSGLKAPPAQNLKRHCLANLLLQQAI
ncbi:MAG: hypothetical protein ACJA2Q_001176 [Pseudohongiellaceae bacterium]|jgi:hypothetical protein